MVKQAMIFASVLSGALVVGILGYNAYQQREQFAKVKSQLVDLQASANLSASQAEEAGAQADMLAAQLRQELTNSQARIEALIREKEQVTRNQRQMEDQMRTALKDKEVTISELQGKLTVNI